ncbi:MAG: 50S ribosomal protein L3 N(5)-glutamine methyltransferase [Gammaproteobacteria bacterium]|nr:50S ribosomal protein L3 N(5)-glutamine methyltransferase [Gammaproteobacteria bacterium]
MSPRQWLRWVEGKFRGARLRYGHGTDNPRDEAVYLVFRALGLEFDCAPGLLDRPVPAPLGNRIATLADRRIRERLPVAYLLNEAWFAGLPFYVDERVVIPRSPIAELIQQRFAPWLAGCRARRVLDVGTGSGCIAVACARAFPEAMVDAADVSPAALAVARRNVAKHGIRGRVRCIRSDVYSALAGRTYDIIVSNPPYVPARTWRRLPPEYRHEPRPGLECGHDGLKVVRRLLAGAAPHLTRRGILVAEVGAGRRALMRAFPRVPFLWPDFEHGGDGVFILQRSDLAALEA